MTCFYRQDVPYKTLLLSIRDTAAMVVQEMLEKYGINKGTYVRHAAGWMFYMSIKCYLHILMKFGFFEHKSMVV